MDKTSILFECSSLKQLTIISKSNLIINDEYCSKNLYKVTLSDKTITIGYLCFKNRNLLNEFEIIESGSINIGKNQFTNCSNLEKISIQSLTEIEYVNSSIIEFGISCFIGAINLTKFVLTGDN